MWFKKKKKDVDIYAEKIGNNVNYNLIRAMINEAKNKICEVKLANGMIITIRPIESYDKQIDILDL